MRILVTGATGVFGRDLVCRLAADGHDVIALARREPAGLPPGATFVAGDVRDGPTVEKAMAGCDTVAHLAFVLAAIHDEVATRAINLGGTTNVLEAMARTGCGRLVFSSSVLAYGCRPDQPEFHVESDPLRPLPHYLYSSHKAEAERLIADAGVEAVVSRSTMVMGREVDNLLLRFFAGPVVVQARGIATRMQMIHQEDIGRFHALACVGGPPGPVNLAGEGIVTPSELSGLIHRPHVTLPERALRSILGAMWRFPWGEVNPAELDALLWWPIVDTTRLRDVWGFRCAWTSAEAAADLGRTSDRILYLGPKEVALPWRFPAPATGVDPRQAGEPGLAPAAAPGVAGEFDDLVDARYPQWTGTNLSEAWPGPLTPLTLSLAQAAFRAADARIAGFLGLPEPLASAVRLRQVGTFGHRLHVNVAVGREVATYMPGSSPEQTDNQFLGAPLPEDFKPTMTAGDAATALKLLARVVPGLVGYRHEAARLGEEAARFAMTPADVAVLDDAALLSRVRLLVELCCQGWAVATVAAILAGGAVSVLERVAGDDAAAVLANRAGGALASGAVLRGVAELTEALRADAAAEETAALLDRLVAAVGHRGPGETELANPVFADAPELLLDVAVKGLANEPARPPTRVRLSPALRALAGMATTATTSREDVRDNLMRLTHALRVAVREWGYRLATRGELPESEDVFFLTFDELAPLPAKVEATVARRRAERDRLARVTLPAVWSGTWVPESVDRQRLVPGQELAGIGVSPGTAIGRVRVLAADGAARGDLEAGEVLVARVTDVGWTHLFGHVAAVVTDIGGLMSHAAVVAREFGIPSVVGTQDGTARLVDGQLVEVDGHAGVVRVLEG